MSVLYTPVQWNKTKYVYDVALLLGVIAYIVIFLEVAPRFADMTRPLDGAILRMRAFGTCAFFMLTMILMIGPLARLDRRFLPVLYNRRHFGVLTCLVAITHAAYVINWYFVFTPIPKAEALLSSNTSFGQLLGFPFEVFGIFALAVLIILAATSHDFWLAFLSAPIWKAIHILIYPAYAAVVAHIAFGYLQDSRNPTFALIACGGALLVAGLHLFAARARPAEPLEKSAAAAAGDWVPVCDVGEIPEGRARIVTLGAEERAAVFRYDGKLSAVSNACAHQNGPLGEGLIVDGCVTCPWHGFQYRPEDGCSPAPFTEKVPTYALKLEGAMVSIDRKAKPRGTFVEPVVIPEGVV